MYVCKGCPQVSCSGPGFWNIQYNFLLNLKFTKRTKAVVFADDALLAITGETVNEIENFSNLELSKITAWSKSDNIIFIEEKCKVM